MQAKDIQKITKSDLQSYKKLVDPSELKIICVPYTGSPAKHPYDHKKVVLLIEPYSSNTSYYEFKTEDIYHIEELPNITDVDGETVTMVRVWLKKKSIGIRSSPFIVENIKE